ncbi:outer membrane protein assembly factor BamB [Vibrio hippocampi]|uniref:Outer membrane protein assembly factor BamB n=1 Tax=Vibrio hippocampi TaxID=654686 RepID=A0ABM8ZF89_9VIBR|nr:outer membrane protein assembly factor BamB [Vibrio hippocampi]CAH0524878.1 Outer membrane protein assembly factor BamB [Vibrio hippocampi]
MKKLFKKWLLPISVLGIIVGCSSEEDSIVMAPLPVVDSEFTPSTEWSSSIGSGVGQYFSNLSPVYAYDNLFVASRDGVVKAYDVETGNTLWQTKVESETLPRLSGGLSAAYEKLYIGTENGEVIALSIENGEELWRANVKGEVLANPVADASLIMVHTSQGLLVGLDQADGSERWTISTDVPNLTLRGDSTPVAESGGVFWGTANGRIAAAIVERGQLIWQQPVGTPKGSTEIDRLVDVDASPIILGGQLFTIGFNGQLISIDLRTGNPVWKRNYSSVSDMATDNRNLYVVTDTDHLVAVDARSGTELWKNNQLEYRQLTDPVIIDGYLVVGDSLGYLHWLDRETGEFVAQQLIHDSGMAVGPTLVDGGYVIMARDGQLKKLTIQ